MSNSDLIRNHFSAYENKDRQIVESLLSDRPEPLATFRLENPVSGFRLRAPASLTPATRLKFESLRGRTRFFRSFV